ncbi:hypothetical protein IC582_009884 [Cucumis melo]
MDPNNSKIDPSEFEATPSELRTLERELEEKTKKMEEMKKKIEGKKVCLEKKKDDGKFSKKGMEVFKGLCGKYKSLRKEYNETLEKQTRES